MLGLIIATALAAATPQFCILSVEEQASTLAIMTPDGEVRTRVEIGKMPHEVEVSPDGRTAFVSQFGITDYDSRIGTPGDHVTRVNLLSGRATGQFWLSKGLRAPHGVKLRPGTRELFVNAEAGEDTMLVYDSRSTRLLRRFPLVKGAHNFIFTREGRDVIVFAGAEGVARYDAASGRSLARVRLSAPVRGLRLTADARVAAAAKGFVAILNPRSLRTERTLRSLVGGQLVYLEALVDGTIIAPSLADGGVVWFDPRGNARLIPTGRSALSARLAPDGLIYVANVDDDHLTVLDQQGRIVRTLGKSIRGPNGLAFGHCPRT